MLLGVTSSRGGAVGLLLAALLVACSGHGPGSTGPARAAAAPTPATSGTCSAAPTPAETEGPYFKAGSPERTALVQPGMAGTRLTVAGLVSGGGCTPVPGTTLDFWQANASGVY